MDEYNLQPNRQNRDILETEERLWLLQMMKAVDINFIQMKADADNGNDQAQFIYALHNINGVGVKQNRKTGIEYLKKSAAQNNSDAIFRLGLAYYYGEIGTPNPFKGMNYIVEAMEQGNECAGMFMAEAAKSIR